jgi:hypothetical protein
MLRMVAEPDFWVRYQMIAYCTIMEVMPVANWLNRNRVAVSSPVQADGRSVPCHGGAFAMSKGQ